MENSSLGGISSGPTTLMSGHTHSFIQEGRQVPTQKTQVGQCLFTSVTSIKIEWFVNCGLLIIRSGLQDPLIPALQDVIKHQSGSLCINTPDRSSLPHRNEMSRSYMQGGKVWRSGYNKASLRVSRKESSLSTSCQISYYTSCPITYSIHTVIKSHLTGCITRSALSFWM